MINLYQPLDSLQKGHWFKLICGASLQHLPAIRNLTLVYTLAGADCIDVAADPAVVQVAREAITTAQNLVAKSGQKNFSFQSSPWLMVSLNDGEDPHFRKAEFEPAACPVNCPKPCISVCPAEAIVFNPPDGSFSGVIDRRCYGCGRCLPVCPTQQISTRAYVYPPEAVGSLLLSGEVDALEIHTRVGRFNEFHQLWQAIAPYVHQLKLIAVSCPDSEGLVDYLWSLYNILSPLPCILVWQTDGRPMSGDIGDGATRAALKLGRKVLQAGLPGYVQLAGGTNSRTVAKLRAIGLLNPKLGGYDFTSAQLPNQKYIAGVAYGSFARTLLLPILNQVDQAATGKQSYWLEATPTLLEEAVSLARSLVAQLKVPSISQPTITPLL